MTEMTDTTATPRGERTREATDRKLMRATLQIAVDRGISGVTIEEVARRSGVAKTTIYRRYHNADELLHEISAMYLAIPDPDPVPSPTREHFTQLLQRLVDWVRDNDIDVKRVGIVLSSEAEFFQHIVDQVVTPWLEHVGRSSSRESRRACFARTLTRSCCCPRLSDLWWRMRPSRAKQWTTTPPGPRAWPICCGQHC